MLRELFVFGTALLYAETILQLYVILSTISNTPWFLFITSLVLLVGAFLISNMTSLAFIFKDNLPKSRANRVTCFVLHVLLLGPVWRISQTFLFGYGIDSQILRVRFVHCGIQSLPILLIYGSVNLQGQIFQNGGIVVLVTLIVSCLSVSVSFSSYSLKYSVFDDINPIGNLTSGKRAVGLALVCIGTFLMLATRLATVLLMSSVVSFWSLLPLGVHFVLIFFTFMTCDKEITWRVKKCSLWNMFRFSVLSFFHVFEMLESNLHVIQCKYVAFYAAILIENIVMSAAWLLYSDQDYLTKLITVVILLILYVCALVSKYSGKIILTKIPENAADDVSVTKGSVFVTKGDPDSFSSKTIKKNSSANLHQSASAESHTTETIISRGTSRRTSVTQKTDIEHNDCIPDIAGDVFFQNRQSSSKKSSPKQNKSLKQRLMFGQANSLFHFPTSSPLRATPSAPETICVSSIDVSDGSPDDIIVSRDSSAIENKRVCGRRGFRLGFRRPYTIHGGINMDDSYLNSRSHLRNPNVHKKLQRTKSLSIDALTRLGNRQPLPVNRLPQASLWYHSSSFSDSFSLCSGEDDYGDYAESPSSRTSSSNTRLTMSSNDYKVWHSRNKSSLFNLDRLPKKSMETDTRIKSWLSETVNIFDLIHEKTHVDQWTLRPGDKHVRNNRKGENIQVLEMEYVPKSCQNNIMSSSYKNIKNSGNNNTQDHKNVRPIRVPFEKNCRKGHGAAKSIQSISSMRDSVKRNAQHIAPVVDDLDSHVQNVYEDLNQELHHQKKNTNNVQQTADRQYRHSERISRGHNSSLKEIDKLKQFIQNTELGIAESQQTSFGDNASRDLNPNTAIPFSTPSQKHCDNIYGVQQTFSYPVSNMSQYSYVPVFQSRHIVNYGDHKTIIAAESLV